MKNDWEIISSIKDLWQTTEFLQIVSSGSFSNIVATFALVMSTIAYRQQRKGNDTFKESLMSDAYSKSQEFSNCLSNIETALFSFSKLTIGGINISHEYGKIDQYQTDDKFRSKIIHRMKSALAAGESVYRNANTLRKIDSDLSKLSYSLSKKDSQKLKELIDKGLHLDGIVRTYVNLVFDYFDDKEFCIGMRYSNHILPCDGVPKAKILENSCERNIKEIYKLSGFLEETCESLNSKVISELYKYK